MIWPFWSCPVVAVAVGQKNLVLIYGCSTHSVPVAVSRQQAGAILKQSFGNQRRHGTSMLCACHTWVLRMYVTPSTQPNYVMFLQICSLWAFLTMICSVCVCVHVLGSPVLVFAFSSFFLCLLCFWLLSMRCAVCAGLLLLGKLSAESFVLCFRLNCLPPCVMRLGLNCLPPCLMRLGLNCCLHVLCGWG